MRKNCCSSFIKRTRKDLRTEDELEFSTIDMLEKVDMAHECQLQVCGELLLFPIASTWMIDHFAIQANNAYLHKKANMDT